MPSRGSSATSASSSTSGTCRSSIATTFQGTRPGVFFGGDAAWGPENIIWAVEHGHQAAISIHNHCQGVPVTDRPAVRDEPGRARSWACTPGVQQRLQPGAAPEDEARRAGEAVLAAHRWRSSWASPPSRRRTRSSAASTATSRPHFTANLCIECDACIDVCPVNCLTIAPPGPEEPTCATRLSAPAENLTQALYVSDAAAADPARDGEGRGRLPALRPVRRALPDRRVGHAAVRAGDPVRGDAIGRAVARVRPRRPGPRLSEARSPGARRATRFALHFSPFPRVVHQRLRVQDRHRQRHRLGERQRAAHAGDLPHGHPGDRARTSSRRTSRGFPPGTRSASARTATPRASRRSTSSSRMNPGDLSRWTSPRSAPAAGSCTTRRGRCRQALAREDITVLGIPFGQLCNDTFNGDRERTLMKNIAYAGALAALLDIDMDRDRGDARREVRRKKNAARLQLQGTPARLRLRPEALRLPAAVPPRADGRDRRPHPHRRQHRRRAGLRLRRARRWARGTRSRRPRR